MGLLDNVKSRKDAEAVIALIDELLDSVGEQRKRSLEIVGKWVLSQLSGVGSEISIPGAMSESKAAEFGKSHLCFGKYEGVLIEDIPLSYLEWLADQTDFQCLTRQYLRSMKALERYRQETPP
jgi:hypothetical protein